MREGRPKESSSSGGLLAVVLRVAVVAGLYFLAARLGLGLATHNRNVTLVWPPSGIAAAAFILWGYRVWPGVTLGAFLANLTNASGIATAAAITVGNTAAPLLAAWFLRRLRFHDALDRVGDVIRLFFVGAVAMTISATAGTAALTVTNSIGDAAATSVWIEWWLGDTFGVILFAPLFILLGRLDRSDLIVQRRLEAVALIIFSVAVTYGTFTLDRPLAFLISVPVVWAALRFDRLGTALVVAIVSVLAIGLTIQGEGQFTLDSPTQDLISLQIFNATVGFASLVLAIVMHQRTRAERALRSSEETYRRVFEQASDLVCIHDGRGALTYVNETTEQLTGYSRERLLAMNISELVSPGSVQSVRRTIARQLSGDVDTATYEVDIVGTGGRRIAMELSSTPVHTEGEATSFQVIGRDITSRLLAADQLRRTSLHDPLTGLANRTLLRERLEYALSLARRDRARVALAIAGLDGFKDVNRLRGHDGGDRLLARFANQLQDAFREPDTVARLQGDEFAILAPSLAPGRELETIAEQIRAEFRTELASDTQTRTSASVGIAVFPDDADDADELIQRADLAMHEAKRAGGDRSTVYRSDLDSHRVRRFSLEDELHRAVDEEAFVLHFQPKVEAATMRTIGVESLIRWDHPRLGFVPPMEFIPLAATNDIMDKITDWVLRRAVAYCATWAGAGMDLGVSINLSGTDLHMATADHLGTYLAEHDFAAERVTVEVNEQDVRHEASHAALERISSLGVQLSVDGFGAAASSMAHLSRLPIAEMKIDRSFVVDVATNTKSHAVARSIIELAHNLGIDAVAVGVETRQAWDTLVELGCDAMQGFMICEPMPANELESWLRTPSWSGRVR
jgi:diguanylate cyclase (GGDEF)-like protein/PAS domain S-box-containing protein